MQEVQITFFLKLILTSEERNSIEYDDIFEYLYDHISYRGFIPIVDLSFGFENGEIIEGDENEERSEGFEGSEGYILEADYYLSIEIPSSNDYLQYVRENIIPEVAIQYTGMGTFSVKASHITYFEDEDHSDAQIIPFEESQQE